MKHNPNTTKGKVRLPIQQVPSHIITKALEDTTIEALINYMNQRDNSDWKREEFSIASISKQLKVGESIPDAIIFNVEGQKIWGEITAVSRNKEDLKKINKSRKKLQDYTDQIERVNLAVLTASTQLQILQAIYKKCKKNYTFFAKHIAAEQEGTLVVVLETRDPFLTEIEVNCIIQSLDHHVLFSWAVGRSYFKEILLYAFVHTSNGWQHKFFIIADKKMMQELKYRQQQKDLDLLQ